MRPERSNQCSLAVEYTHCLVCYKIFDHDQDSRLNMDELRAMALGLLEVQTANYCPKDQVKHSQETKDDIVNNIVSHVLRHSSREVSSLMTISMHIVKVG